MAEREKRKERPMTKLPLSKRITSPNPNPNPTLTTCQRCSVTSTDLETLASQWRIALLCINCHGIVSRAEACSYCFIRLDEEEEDDSSFLNCVRCFRRVHNRCVHRHRYYVSGLRVNPESFACVDCLPSPMWSGKTVPVVTEEPQWVVNGSKTVSRNIGRVSSGSDSNANVDFGDSSADEKEVVVSAVVSDKWEWIKRGQTVIRGLPTPRLYYRCKNFPQRCTAKKHVEQSKTDPSMFVITYIGKHNHSFDALQNPLLSLEWIDGREPQKEVEGSSPTGCRSGQQDTVVVSTVSSDKWEWLEYETRPIKGSLHPRLYYRCKSFSDGCIAQKHVERSQTDQEMFVITYIAEHNHPIYESKQLDLAIAEKEVANSESKLYSSESKQLDLAIAEPGAANEEIKGSIQQKKVMISHEFSDKWEWLKYGTRPQKGSSYPRLYYRCKRFSTGCIAKKHVERSQEDPNMFVVTYIDQHNHFEDVDVVQDLSSAPGLINKNTDKGKKGSKRCGSKSDLHKKVVVRTVSSDKWEWLKYDTRPLKRSSYPKFYYRCKNFSDGCIAQKQVTRSQTDPGMFIITYVGDHSHPSQQVRQFDAGDTNKKVENTDSEELNLESIVDNPAARSDQHNVVVSHVSTDKWEWMKYATRSVKDSPYPRLYYRCRRFSDGCIARKVVDRNQIDPDLFVITYDAEHNHQVDVREDQVVVLDMVNKEEAQRETDESSLCGDRIRRKENTSSPSSSSVQLPSAVADNTTLTVLNQIHRSKRKKQRKKVVCQILENDVSSDKWAWSRYTGKKSSGPPHPKCYNRQNDSYKSWLAKQNMEEGTSS